MPASTLTLEQRIAHYAFEAAEDPRNLRAMETVIKIAPTRQNAERATPRAHHPPTAQSSIEPNLVESVRTVAQGMLNNIIVTTVLKKMEESHFRFTSADHEKSVRDALQRLTRQGYLEVAKKGNGGKPNTYRVKRAGTGK